jgi:hypothetical protein
MMSQTNFNLLIYGDNSFMKVMLLYNSKEESCFANPHMTGLRL